MSERVGMYYKDLLGIETRLQQLYCKAAADSMLDELEKSITTAVLKDVIVSADVAMKYLTNPISHEIHNSNRHYGTAAGLQER